MRRVFVALSIFTILFILMGCSAKEQTVVNEMGKEKASGRMREEIVDNRELTAYVIEQAENGRDWAIGRSEKDAKVSLLESMDRDQTWEVLEVLPQELQTEQEEIEGNREMFSAALCNGMWCVIMWVRGAGEGIGKAEYWLWTPGIKLEQIDLPIPKSQIYEEQSMGISMSIHGEPEYLLDICSAGEGRIIGCGANAEIFMVDMQDQKILWSVKMKEEQRTIAIKQIVGKELYMIRYDGVSDVYDLETGEFIREDKLLTELMSGFSIGYNTIATAAGKDNDMLYLLNETGLYSHSVHDNVGSEVLIFGEDAEFGKTNYSPRKLQAEVDGSFTVYGYSGDGIFKTLRYFPETGRVVPEKELLRVYSLYENEEIQQASAAYDNPGVRVVVEIGIQTDSAITYSDAVKQLNTQLVTGDGPDILILDGIDLDNYSDKRMFTDLGDILTEVWRKDGIHPIIWGNFGGDQISYMPTHYKINVILGEEKEIEKVDGIEAMRDAYKISQQSEQGSVRACFEKLYNLCYSSLITHEGLNKEVMYIFLDVFAEMTQEVDVMVEDIGYEGITPLQCILNDLDYSFGILDSFGSLGMIETVMNERDGWGYREVSEGAGMNMIPETIVAVYKNSGNRKRRRISLHIFFRKNVRCIHMKMDFR